MASAKTEGWPRPVYGALRPLPLLEWAQIQ